MPILLCPDWTGLDSDSGSSAGLDWIRISGSWIWTGLDRFNSIHSIPCRTIVYFLTAAGRLKSSPRRVFCIPTTGSGGFTPYRDFFSVFR